MYLGKKKAELSAADNGIVASVAPAAESGALFVPQAWEQEVAVEAVAEAVAPLAAPALKESV